MNEHEVVIYGHTRENSDLCALLESHVIFFFIHK